jgi:Secretion system C-terminal sorting domain/Carboxypeptidase regulatory-like domain
MKTSKTILFALVSLYLLFSSTINAQNNEYHSTYVGNDTKTVTVSGKVELDSGQPFYNAVIWLQNIINNNTYLARTDNNGNYSIAVDSGSYYLDADVNYVQGNMLTRQRLYYKDQQSFDYADIIIFSNDTSGINFVFPTLTLGSISGTIRDAATQQPLSNVSIAINSIESIDSTFIETDQKGNYSIQAFEGSYILYAYEQGYFFDYYKDVNNSFDATRVVITKDSSNATGIDFNLTKPVPGSNSISGAVFGTTDPEGFEVYAIPANGEDWVGTRTSSNGGFSIVNLTNGKYVLLFYKEGYKSQYYGDSLNTINLTGDTNVSNIFVIMEKLNAIGGEIDGAVTSNSNLPLSGTLLTAVNSSGDTVSTSISDHSGNYRIPALPNGGYIIIANKIGYEKVTYPQKVEVNLSSSPIVNGINISITTTSIDDNHGSLPKAFVLSQNYPNPFNPTTTIKYEIPKAIFVSIKIYDLLGREVATLVNNERLAGKYEVKFDGSKLSSGIYFYRMQAGGFIDSKKLILLK